MNPLRWVRWKVVAILAVLGAAVYFLGLDKVALKELNSAGSESKAARWSASDLALGILGGNARLTDLMVDAPDRRAAPPGDVARGKAGDAGGAAGAGDDVFEAAGVHVDLSMTELLARRYVVDRVAIDAPKVAVTRREDGTIDIEDFGEPEPGAAPPSPGELKDWYETAKRWYERLQKAREARKKLPERKRAPREPGYGADYTRGAAYPFEGRPTYAVREITATGFQVTFRDEARRSPIPPLENGTVTVKEVTSSPGVQSEATSFAVSGQIAGAKLEVQGSLDLRGGKSELKLERCDTGDLPASVVDAFVGASLPVKLSGGTVRVSFDRLSLDGAEALEVAPRLAFKGVRLEPRDPAGKIAGLPAAELAAAFNEAMQEMPELEIADLKITGSLASPRLEWGDTVKNLVVSGGKAFARRQFSKEIEKGTEVLRKELEKAPVSAEVKEKVKDVLEGLPAKGLPALGEGLKGILGGSKEKKEKKEKPAGDEPGGKK
ncbi:MAG: DUF748 domain-containing protein [Planctomycetes bacterium]|nr:DUF748 domain-containing protein [Planctomycetota bacterium]